VFPNSSKRGPLHFFRFPQAAMSVFAWGSNGSGQLGQGPQLKCAWEPKVLADLEVRPIGCIAFRLLLLQCRRIR
jgi:hypothetical protein